MIDKRIAIVGIPGKWSTEVLADRLEAHTGFRCVVDMANVVLELETGTLRHGDVCLNELDGIIIKKVSEVYSPAADDRIRMLSRLEDAGVPCFSSPQEIGRLINRLQGTAALTAQGIPLPPTVVTENREEALKAVKRFGRALLKPLYSTKARGMVILDAADNDAHNQDKLDHFQQAHGLFYLQQFIELGGQDLGMMFVGGDYLCTYARVGDGDAWNTTIQSGGKYQTFDPDPELIALGRRAQACFSLSFTTVDIALTEMGPVVFEVSAFGGFSGSLEGCGMDAAEALCQHVLTTLSSHHKGLT